MKWNLIDKLFTADLFIFVDIIRFHPINYRNDLLLITIYLCVLGISTQKFYTSNKYSILNLCYLLTVSWKYYVYCFRNFFPVVLLGLSSTHYCEKPTATSHAPRMPSTRLRTLCVWWLRSTLSPKRPTMHSNAAGHCTTTLMIYRPSCLNSYLLWYLAFIRQFYLFI